jgi:hypothetical protein
LEPIPAPVTDPVELVLSLEKTDRVKDVDFVTPENHCWEPDHQVLSTSEKGDTIIHYNPLDGSCNILFSIWCTPYEMKERTMKLLKETKAENDVNPTEEELTEKDGNATEVSNFKSEFGGPGNLECIISTKNIIILGGKVR